MPLELAHRSIRKGLEMPARKALECCKLNLMEDCSHSSEDQNAGKNADGKDQAREVSFGKKDSIGSWTQDCVRYDMVESLSLSCSCPETLQETKDDRPINLAEEMSRQSNIWAGAWVLLMVFSQLYIENQEQKSCLKNVQFCQKGRACKV